MSNLFVQYGCGLSAPQEWQNFDISPTLRIQKIPIIGNMLKPRLNSIFPDNVRYGDIIKGLPFEDNTCDGIYCSHTLEHLSLEDFRISLKNTYKILKIGGFFRCVVPDFEYYAKEYIKSFENENSSASIDFFKDTLLGFENRPKGIKGLLKSFLGNSRHLWMWDSKSLSEELRNAGFSNVRTCKFNDSQVLMFKYVEESASFKNAVAFECVK